jgi:hypothetical protein
MSIRQGEGAKMLKSLDAIETAARRAGSHWFDRDAKRFFSSRVSEKVYPFAGGAYFVSSERCSLDHLRLYSVRMCTDAGKVDTIGDFQAYRTSKAAHAAAKRLARE